MKTLFQNTKEHFNSHDVLILLLLTGALFMFRFPVFLQPWGGDQGVYGYIANGMLDGSVPYKDMYTSTGYGVFFAYALFFKLFGNSMLAVHMGDFMASALNVVLVYFLTRMLFGKESAVIAGIVLVIFGSGRAFSGLYDMKGAWGTYWYLAQREVFMTPLITAGVLFALLADRSRKGHLYFWAGIFIGLAAVLKMTAVLMLMMLSLYIILNELFGSEGGGWRSIISKLSGLSAGAVVIQLPFLYYFWAHDSLSLMYNAVFVHTSIYARLSRGNILANAFQGNSYILIENLPLWLFSLASIVYLMIYERKRENCLMAAWTLVTMVMIFGQGKFFGYHYLLIMAPFSVLTGLGIRIFLKSSPSWKDSILAARHNMLQIFMWTVLAASAGVFALNSYEYYRWNTLYLTGKIAKDRYYEVFNEFPLHLYSFPADYEVANYLKANAGAGASLCTVNGGGDTVINYLSGVKSATRFTSTWYLFNKGLYDDPLTDRLRDEFIDGIITEKPGYILLIYYSLEEFRKEYNGIGYDDIGRLMEYIENNYTLEKSFRDRRTLYRRI